jgi:dTDP-4-dehydrorhamnose reductase
VKVLVFGISGMIGHTVFRILTKQKSLSVVGVSRANVDSRLFRNCKKAILDFTCLDSLMQLYSQERPEVVINCSGITKHNTLIDDPLMVLQMNSIFPRRLAELGEVYKSRTIQVSTDCVFSGTRGEYTESDKPDASDLYGRSKVLGEIKADSALTLRISTIGHELAKTRRGLLEWFLVQKSCEGFSNAFFSGVTTLEFAHLLRDFVLPNHSLSGLYHVGSNPIDKYSLLCLINQVYDLNIDIIKNASLTIDRTLNSNRFKSVTGYLAPDWPSMISSMRQDYISGG